MNANNIPISNAIRKLTDTIKWGVSNDYDISTIEWRDTEVTRPTDVEIQAMRQQMANDQNTIAYTTLRKEGKYAPVTDDNGEIVHKKVADGYPPIEDQLDAMWKGGDAMTAMRAKILAVKQRFPKPE
jgi:hypothetical protein